MVLLKKSLSAWSNADETIEMIKDTKKKPGGKNNFKEVI